MKPTNRSLAPVDVIDPELAVVPVPDAPIETSSALTVATPENSCTVSAIVEAEAVWAVTDATAFVLAEYHSSPSELCPDTNLLAMRVQVSPAESVTEVMVLVAPVYTLADRTRRCPAVDADVNAAVSAVDDVTSVADALWMSAGPVVGGGFTVSEMVVV